MSEATQSDPPMTRRARDRFETARSTFGGDQPELLVCKLVEPASGMDLRVAGDSTRHRES